MNPSRALLAEWLAAEGVIMYRAYAREHHVVMPGELLAASGVFMLLALAAEVSEDAGKLAALLGGGFVIAAMFQLAGKIGQAQPPVNTSPAPDAGRVTAA